MVQDIVRRVREVRPGIRVNVHAVPWREADFGGGLRKIVAQDLTAISKVTDYVSPMCYSAMLQREPAWISSVVAEFGATARCPIIPSIQVKESYPGDRPLGAADFEACLRAALQPPSAGVVFWSWDLIKKARESKLVIKRTFNPSR
jgi:hypothetical protein